MGEKNKKREVEIGDEFQVCPKKPLKISSPGVYFVFLVFPKRQCHPSSAAFGKMWAVFFRADICLLVMWQGFVASLVFSGAALKC